MQARLRPLLSSDLETLFEIQCDPIAERIAGGEYSFNIKSKNLFVTMFSQFMDEDRAVARAIINDIGQVSGYIFVAPPNVSGDFRIFPRVGFWIARRDWAKGYATSALKQILKIVTTRPILADIHVDNIASKRVLVKNGFIEIGNNTIRCSNGRTIDMAILELGGLS